MAELEGIQNDQEGHPSNPFSGLFGPQIQLPKFSDEKDSFDAFVARFESVARSQKWSTEHLVQGQMYYIPQIWHRMFIYRTEWICGPWEVNFRKKVVGHFSNDL